MSNRTKDNSELKPDKCMKCNQSNLNLLASYDCISFLGYCDHLFCKKCFKNVNTDDNNFLKCPCCIKQYYEYLDKVNDEALLIGEAAYLNYKAEQQSLQINADPIIMHNLLNDAIEKFKKALLLTPSNPLLSIIITRCILYACLKDLDYLSIMEKQAVRPADRLILKGVMYTDSNSYSSKQYCLRQRVHECCLNLLDKAFDRDGRALIHCLRKPEGQPFDDTTDRYYNILCGLFYACDNNHASLKYAQLAVDACKCPSDHPNLALHKQHVQRSKIAFDQEPPLRFALGDEVEFLVVEEDGTSEWKPATVVELYYRERDFPLVFTAPYRLQLIEESSDSAPVYAWVKADLDRYVRKPGVKLIEDTRYQARLDAKVEELAQVYCSKEFIQGIYHTLAQDRQFVDAR